MTVELIPPGAPEFAELFHQFRYSAYRLETLQQYGHSGEDEDFAAFMAGQPKPANHGHDEWQGMVRGNARAGRVMQRVHVVTEPLSDYMRLELTWGYGPNSEAGEDIRIITVERGWPEDIPQHDYWLFDSHKLYRQHYDSANGWLGVEPVTDSDQVVAACRARDAALHQATRWVDYIAARPNLAAYVPAPRSS